MIRLAQNKDIDGIMSLLHQVNDVHAAGRPDLFVAGRTKYSRSELTDILNDTGRPVFVFVVPGSERVCGYCFCVFTNAKSLYIDDLCVDAAIRGRGIGRELYSHVVDYARNAGCHNITLNVWTCNPGAMRFYESLGLVPQKITLEKILDL